MKTNRPTICILYLVLLAACGPDKQATATSVRATQVWNDKGAAWATCNSASGSPSGNRVSGKVYELSSDNGEPLESYYASYNAMSLSDASVVFCIEFTTRLYETCEYQLGTKLPRYYREARVKLLAWPSRELIAQSTIKGRMPTPLCPAVYDPKKIYYNIASVDLQGWLEQYVTITK